MELSNDDLTRMAHDFTEQALAIRDDEPYAVERRTGLNEAAGHILLASAALMRVPRLNMTLREEHARNISHALWAGTGPE